MKGYTLFWDAEADFSKLPDDALNEALKDAEEVLAGMFREDPHNPVDTYEQGALVSALKRERGRRALASEDTE